MRFISSTYSIFKSRKIYRYAHKVYHKKRSKLSDQKRHEFESQLEKLDAAIQSKDSSKASEIAHHLNDFVKTYFPKNLWDQSKELVFALIFAIVVAFVIRQLWFELYEVPTGSMRPTIKELDRLVVSKTTFGINPPFSNDLVLFKPEYVKRGGIIVFTVENMDVADADTIYFYLFPGKKRYIKRCMGKAGDIVYFYGGRIYGIDENGNDITELYDESFLKSIGIEKIDHVPYINFDGKVTSQNSNRNPTLILKQMNLPIGKFQISDGTLQGLFFNGKEWLKDNPTALLQPHNSPQSYADLWGFKNYAMVRMLNPEQYQALSGNISNSSDLSYLEIYHTPNLTYPNPQIRRDENGIVRPMITPFVTYLPLNRTHIDLIQKGLYTARFIVKNGKAYRYHESGYNSQRSDFDVSLPNVPDGTYEFYYGVAYSVGFTGMLSELPKDHALYDSSVEMIQKLFNLGINFNTLFNPITQYVPYLPQRFAYFREGSLYVMGFPIMHKDDPNLIEFLKNEFLKEKQSVPNKPYIAFKDWGAPLKDGKIDKEFIRAFGLRISQGDYLALGDNYAMSADSREFGFVPATNLRGAPSFTIWPFGKRFGTLPQTPYPWMTLPNLIIWGIVTIIFAAWFIYIHNRNKKRFERF